MEVFELSKEERGLIEKYLPFYSDLAKGVRRPITEAQKHFFAVTQGRTVAETDHEKAYIKWKRLEAQRIKQAEKGRKETSIEEFPPGVRPYPAKISDKFAEEWESADPPPWEDPFRYG